jgi:hypothetical protein
MVNGIVQLETDGAARGNRDSLSGGRRTGVAPDVVRSNARDRRVVQRFANGCRRRGASCNQVIPNI